MNDKNPDRISDQIVEKKPDHADHEEPDGHGSGQVNPPMKGRDIPATTDLEYIDREKGKRTTM